LFHRHEQAEGSYTYTWPSEKAKERTFTTYFFAMIRTNVFLKHEEKADCSSTAETIMPQSKERERTGSVMTSDYMSCGP